ncbi:hypothetical protein XHV734_1821 [Xanthomonas hortorum pv. vitians]|nr:hypothetical protein XHV734_1821 [Xanthomonas hortorum pv. vitians]
MSARAQANGDVGAAIAAVRKETDKRSADCSSDADVVAFSVLLNVHDRARVCGLPATQRIFEKDPSTAPVSVRSTTRPINGWADADWQTVSDRKTPGHRQMRGEQMNPCLCSLPLDQRSEARQANGGHNSDNRHHDQQFDRRVPFRARMSSCLHRAPP